MDGTEKRARRGGLPLRNGQSPSRRHQDGRERPWGLGHGDHSDRKEYDTYIDLVTHRPELARSYCVYFGDIYTANAALLPTFDVVTLFRLCEFRTEENDAYGALTDLELTRLFTERTRPGGHFLFYTGSYAYAQAETVITEWAASSTVEEVEGFKTLRVFRKVGAGAPES
ncbi:hypothetical protein [Brevundimonas sp. TWP2-3-2]|uniref:hypothetical protein n=1 Tax=unclassified Brevundimonas TaxID=2622653 RepID=UPI003CEEF54C